MKNNIMIEHIKLLRPKQWIKNLFIFPALIFSMSFFDIELLKKSIECFILFCCTSSSIYILNDIVDIEKDKQHPKKRNRPLAKGTVKVKNATIIALVLIIIALGGSMNANKLVSVSIIFYIINNVLYSFKIKNIMIIDVISIAIGFILRVSAGAFAIDVSISPWLLVCTFFIALFLGLGKRKNELLVLDINASNHRENLRNYTQMFIDQMIVIVVGCTIMAYSLYTFTAYDHIYMMLTIPFVVYGIFRYLYIIYVKDEGGSPTEIVLTDKPIIIDVLLWGLLSSFIIVSTQFVF